MKKLKIPTYSAWWSSNIRRYLWMFYLVKAWRRPGSREKDVLVDIPCVNLQQSWWLPRRAAYLKQDCFIFLYLLGHWAFLQTNISSNTSKFTCDPFHALFALNHAVVDFIYSLNYIGHWVGIYFYVRGKEKILDQL